MKHIQKILVSMVFSLIIVVSSLVTPATTFAVNGASCTNPGLCGSAAVGCDTGEICEDTWGLGGNCAASNGRCENRDQDRAEICGFTNQTDGWCGVSGGCAQGYLCNGLKQVCELSNGSAGAPGGATCKNASNVYNEQCGWSTSNQCGAAGVCEQGYRCVSVPSTISRTGYACRPDPAGTANMCPGSPNLPAQPVQLLCGQTTDNPSATCGCTGASLTLNPNINQTTDPSKRYCCGWINGSSCSNTAPTTPTTPVNPVNPVNPNNPVDPANNLNIFSGPNSKDFEALNPLKSQGTESINSAYFTSPAGIISRVLLFAFPIAGLILFIMLVWAGFQILMGAFQGGSKAIDAGKQRATTALVGFLLLFVSYWIMQIIETIFSITIL